MSHYSVYAIKKNNPTSDHLSLAWVDRDGDMLRYQGPFYRPVNEKDVLTTLMLNFPQAYVAHINWKLSQQTNL